MGKPILVRTKFGLMAAAVSLLALASAVHLAGWEPLALHGKLHSKISAPMLEGTAVALSATRPGAGPSPPRVDEDRRQRRFLTHRGVHLRSTIAGELSLEAIHLSRRAGFEAIELDVRLTADGHLIVMHDVTLNRTCLNADGTNLEERTFVADKTLQELKEKYILKAHEPRNRTRIPTLREFLAECRVAGLLPFIEPKINDETGRHYQDIIRLADDVVGAGNYVITSNNLANRVIRRLGLKDVPLMGILHQTTFEEIVSQGNIIMALSASRFTANEFAAHATRALAAGLRIEAHADDYARFRVIDTNAVDYVSTDLLAPDLKPNTELLRNYTRLTDFNYAGRNVSGVLMLSPGETISLKVPLPKVHFGGVYMEVEIKGECDVRLGNQDFSIRHPGNQPSRHQLMLYETAAEFRVTARDECEIKSLSVALVEF